VRLNTFPFRLVWWVSRPAALQPSEMVFMAKLVGKSNPAYRHGYSPRTGQSSEYMTWQQMLQRCTNPNNAAYSDYGGRGITVCKRWRSFTLFIEDIGPRPAGFCIERINNALGYCPTNCRWASRAENNRNKRNNIFLTFAGVTLTAKDWSLRSCVSYRAFHKRIKRGWPLAKALNTPSLSK